MEKKDAKAKEWLEPMEAATVSSKEERTAEAKRLDIYAKTFQWIDQRAGN